MVLGGTVMSSQNRRKASDVFRESEFLFGQKGTFAEAFPGIKEVSVEQSFLSFIDEVLSVLELPEAPEHSLKCQWCSYLSKMSNPPAKEG